MFLGLFGLSGFECVFRALYVYPIAHVFLSTRAATYHVIIDCLKHLPKTKMDAAFGLPALVFLYAVRFGCEKLSKRCPRFSKSIVLAPPSY